ncbi:prenyltransferase [Halomonas korlensis]|uniref:1,4-dihydroxy-2-naphthoate octaprenyltransferase n=1 Tax=Halomonas korlensis TaxID=463301 RepID=A0A1I7IVP4_9GAMM|nr:prenyltransferase [Halomonas korlensis]SFU76941.1 1,4-dihydroxy-2-naphthoate octaprenyltransferase [Halomonas korlensis]
MPRSFSANRLAGRATSAIALARAARPNFLVLAPLCGLLGVLLAARQPVMLSGYDIVLVLVGGLLAHVAVNLLNEYEDFRSGLDLLTRRTPFSGGSGALPETPQAAPWVLAAGLGALACVMAIGVYFLWLRGWSMLIIGLGGVGLVLAYTRWITRRPWLCLLAPGLGFGPVMVLGTLVALGGQVDATAMTIAGVSLSLVSELLLLNQFPDLEADRRSGRRHLPIVLGLKLASRLAMVLLLGAYGLIALGQLSGALPMAVWLAWATFPAALWVVWQLPDALEERQLMLRVLSINVATLLTTLALLGIGLWLA